MKNRIKKKPGDDQGESPTSSVPALTVTDKAKGTPAKEIEPDQSVLNKPAPKPGMSLIDSWNSSQFNRRRK